MTTIVSELYAALKAAGVDDDVAKAAAKSVIAIEDKEQLATKADLSSLKVELIAWNLGAIIAVAGLVSTIVALLPHG
jgi:hypothetical protein